MPKKTKKDWNEVRGAYTSDDPGLTRDDSGLGYSKPVDISKKVDPSWQRNGGFAGQLDKGKE
jgi:hypothetical protein